MAKKYYGSCVAIVTPFVDGQFDESAYRALIEWQIASGTHVIVACGTTGEASTLSFEEQIEVIKVAIDAAKGRVPVIAGTGGNNTAEAIYLTQEAERLGVDAVLVVVPYYNKPTQEGLYQHYRTIAESTRLPIILYNVPSRTGINMTPATVARLAKIKNIIGIKEASGDMGQVGAILAQCGEDFQVFSGNDSDTLPVLALGGCGTISVTANIMPAECAQLYAAWQQGDLQTARTICRQLDAVNRAMFIESNPIMVKYALAMMGKIREEYRLPLCSPEPTSGQKLAEVLAKNGILIYVV